jgi:cytochrome c-type biogenesis protein CcmH/NrfG
MPIQKYDIRLPASQGDGFVERYWSPINSPVLEGEQVQYIIHRVEDVTEFMRLQKAEGQHDKRINELRMRTRQMAAELFLRGRELADAQQLIAERKQAEEALREMIPPACRRLLRAVLAALVAILALCLLYLRSRFRANARTEASMDLNPKLPISDHIARFRSRRRAVSDDEFANLKSAVERQPASLSAWYKLGEAQSSRGSHREAVDSFTEACRLDRNMAAAYYQCAIEYFLLGEWVLASDRAHSARDRGYKECTTEFMMIVTKRR